MKYLCRTFLGTISLVLSGLVMSSCAMAGDVLVNSSIACVQGVNKTNLTPDCSAGRNELAIAYINRVICGARPLSSNCTRTASFTECCSMDSPEMNCVFECATDLVEFSRRFAGTPGHPFLGERRSTVGSCNQSTFPSLASFVSVEYGCVGVGLLQNIASRLTWDREYSVYLDSNGYFNNTQFKDITFQCLLRTNCGSTITFTAYYVLWGYPSSAVCSETYYIQDAYYAWVNKSFVCNNQGAILNMVMLTTVSNKAVFRMTIQGDHLGKVLFRVSSSDSKSRIMVSCGIQNTPESDTFFNCPNSSDATASPGSVPTITAEMTDFPNTGFTVMEVLSTEITQSWGTMTEPAPIVNTTPALGVEINLSSSQPSTGAIVGIIFAVLILLIIGGLVLVFLVRQQKKKTETERNNTLTTTGVPVAAINPNYQQDTDPTVTTKSPYDHPECPAETSSHSYEKGLFAPSYPAPPVPCQQIISSDYIEPVSILTCCSHSDDRGIYNEIEDRDISSI